MQLSPKFGARWKNWRPTQTGCGSYTYWVFCHLTISSRLPTGFASLHVVTFLTVSSDFEPKWLRLQQKVEQPTLARPPTPAISIHLSFIFTFACTVHSQRSSTFPGRLPPLKTPPQRGLGPDENSPTNCKQDQAKNRKSTENRQQNKAKDRQQNKTENRQQNCKQDQAKNRPKIDNKIKPKVNSKKRATFGGAPGGAALRAVSCRSCFLINFWFLRILLGPACVRCSLLLLCDTLASIVPPSVSAMLLIVNTKLLFNRPKLWLE